MSYTQNKGGGSVLRRTIDDILREWRPEAEADGIRIVGGDDGRPKVQVRLDLGLLQIELEGRPDGLQPHGFASLLDYHLAAAEAHRQRCGTVEDYRLDPAECDALRREAAQYYQRYLSLHQIQRHREVARDTARNLRVLEFLRQHAAAPEDSWELEQFRPYITMMNALARAEMHVADYDFGAAERILVTSMAAIRSFAAQHVGQVDVARELDVLGQRLRQVKRVRPKSERELVRRQLDAAIQREDYEAAALLRDRLAGLAGRV
jgi:hypothetical protein